MNDPTQWNTDHIIEVLSESARIAMRHYESPRTSVKSDHSLVTEADQEIESFLASRLEVPGKVHLIGEETIHTHDPEYIDDALSGVAMIVDPIDGTAPYAHHISTWGISIGRMEQNRLTDGGIYLPVTDELFITNGDIVEYGSISGPRTVIPKVSERTRSGRKRTTGMIALSQGVAKGQGINVRNPVQALGCAVLPLTYLLLDRFVAYIGKVKLWDCAAALPMLERVGYISRLRDGTTVGTRVDETNYRLGADEKERWRLRSRLVCGATEDITEYLVNSLLR